MFFEYPKMLYSAAGSVIVESREEEDDKDPALWFATPEMVYVAPKAEEAEEPVKRGPGRPKKVQ
jgi:hypothetical protein